MYGRGVLFGRLEQEEAARAAESSRTQIARLTAQLQAKTDEAAGLARDLARVHDEVGGAAAGVVGCGHKAGRGRSGLGEPYCKRTGEVVGSNSVLIKRKTVRRNLG